MKLVKTASGKETIKISKSSWESIGRKAGWMKISEDVNRDTTEVPQEGDRTMVEPTPTAEEFKNPYFFIGANPTVDLVAIRDSDGVKEILLVKRAGPVEGGKLALPGGFIDTDAKQGEEFLVGKESPEQAAKREALEETGFNAKSLSITPIGVFEGGNRDPRDNEKSWSKSFAFAVYVPQDINSDIERGADAMGEVKDKGWIPLDKALQSDLAFDHRDIIRAGLRTLGISVGSQ